jgi:hypothetical protein
LLPYVFCSAEDTTGGEPLRAAAQQERAHAPDRADGVGGATAVNCYVFVQLKTQLEENRAVLQHSKNAHMRQIEQMESEELLAQKKLRTEVIQLEDMLAQVPEEIYLN